VNEQCIDSIMHCATIKTLRLFKDHFLPKKCMEKQAHLSPWDCVHLQDIPIDSLVSDLLCFVMLHGVSW